MFRLVYTGNSLPASFICDPSAEFSAGMVAQLTVQGNQVVCTVSNGIAPLGIIDDYKTRAFTNVSWNEEVRVPAVGGLDQYGKYVTPVEIKTELKKANIIRNSFISTVACELNPVNGIITFPAGTELNVDLIGSGQPSGIRAICNYTYYVANIPGDDSTMASGRVTVWYDRMFFQTTMYETNQQYPVNANLFVSEVGLLTTRRPSAIHPSVGLVCGPPSATTGGALGVMWL